MQAYSHTTCGASVARYYRHIDTRTIGKSKAALEIGHFQCGGFIAWLLRGCGSHRVARRFPQSCAGTAQMVLELVSEWRDARLITGSAGIRLN